MKRTLVTAPSELPVTLEEVRQWLSFTASLTADDPVLEQLIGAVTAYVEERTNGFVFIRQTWEVAFDSDEIEQYLRPRIVPVHDVPTITAYDTDDSPTVIDPADYYVREGYDPFVAAVNGWPPTRPFEGLVLTVEAGYENAESVPGNLKQLLRSLISFVYASKGVGVLETVSGQVIGVPHDIRRQIDALRIYPV